MSTPKSPSVTQPSFSPGNPERSPGNPERILLPHRHQIGRYEIIYPIAQGGMASVYVGRLSGMAGFEKLYAIKVIHPHLSGEESYINMFLDEARLAAGIQHPNVAEIFEVGHDEDVLYMVGEFVHGQSLRTFYSRAAALGVDVSQPVAAYIISRVCQGLQAAHNHRGMDEQPLNLVHRDISPSNILLSYDGFVKVIDFGVAFAQGRLSETIAGTIKGKIGFLPPEQIRGSDLDKRADIFSLGVVLYIMATGSAPFRGATEAEQLYKVLNGRFPSPREANPSVQPMLERIILTAMALRRDDRYPTADAMRKDLVRFIRKAGAQVGSEGLSKLMRSLFADELVRHKELVKEFRKKNRSPGDGQGPSTDEPTSSLTPERTKSGLTKFKHDHLTAVVTRGDRIWPRYYNLLQSWLFTRYGALGAIILGCTLIISLSLAVFSKPDEHEPANLAHNGTIPPLGAKTAKLYEPLYLALRYPGLSYRPPAEIIMVRLELTLIPANARVHLDGEAQPEGTTTLELPADGALHDVEISAPGYVTVARRFSANKNQAFVANLLPVGSRPAPNRGGGGSSSGGGGGSSGSGSGSGSGKINIPIRKSPYD